MKEEGDFDTARRLFVSKFGKEPSKIFAESIEAEAMEQQRVF